jgi:hypothetical protein
VIVAAHFAAGEGFKQFGMKGPAVQMHRHIADRGACCCQDHDIATENGTRRAIIAWRGNPTTRMRTPLEMQKTEGPGSDSLALRLERSGTERQSCGTDF